MKLSFKYRIIASFVGLLAFSLITILMFTYQWISKRVEEDTNAHLRQCTEVLKRVHESEIDKRSRQFRSLAVEPRFRALAEIRDSGTLQYASKEVRNELQCAIFGFVTPDGEVLAWDGVGRRELEGAVRSLTLEQPQSIAQLFVVDQSILQVVMVGIQIEKRLVAYIVGAQKIDSSILRDYSIAVGGDLEIRMNHRILAANQTTKGHGKKTLTSELPINETLRYIVKLDPEYVRAPLRDTFRILVYLSIICLLAGVVISIGIANSVAGPVQDLALTSKAVGEGNMGVRATVAGAPEFELLARNFNGMIESLAAYQEKLKDHAARLEQEVQERTHQAHRLDVEVKEHKQTMIKLREALIAAKAATLAKSEFLANMSHELRTPLHGILSFARFGIRKHKETDPEKKLHYFRRIEQSGQILLALLNDLLDLSKLESGKMDFEFQETDITLLIRTVIDEMGAIASEKRLTINYRTPEENCTLNIDPYRITQVIRNFLSNAIKFSVTEGVVDVYTQRGNGALKASVRDYGVGIPENELETVFDKFIQSSKTKTGAGGTGLGLSICKEIILAHKGRIWAENDPDGGAVFSFEIPTDLKPHEPQESTSKSSKLASKTLV